MRSAAFLIFLCGSLSLKAQTGDSVRVSFLATAGMQPVKPDVWMHVPRVEDSFQINTLRFYVSAVSLWQGDQSVWQERDSYHLVDVFDEAQAGWTLFIPAGIRYNRLVFTLGIDSTTNAGGARGGALDAARGMYWAWQSGYINLKLEGRSPHCNTRHRAFQFHLGGFRDGYACAVPVTVPVKENEPIGVAVAVDLFLKDTDLRTQNTVMIPGEEAVKLSHRAVKMFTGF